MRDNIVPHPHACMLWCLCLLNRYQDYRNYALSFKQPLQVNLFEEKKTPKPLKTDTKIINFVLSSKPANIF